MIGIIYFSTEKDVSTEIDVNYQWVDDLIDYVAYTLVVICSLNIIFVSFLLHGVRTVRTLNLSVQVINFEYYI